MRRSGKAWLTRKIAERESRDGKDSWVVGPETTDIYVDGKIDRTVPTDSLFKAGRRGMSPDCQREDIGNDCRCQACEERKMEQSEYDRERMEDR